MKIRLFILAFLFLSSKTIGQEFKNLIQNLNNVSVTSLDYQAATGTTFTYIFPQGGAPFNGEYKMNLSNFPWGNKNLINTTSLKNNIMQYAISYEIEAVSFPFSIDCAFPSSNDPDGGCDLGTPARELNVPPDAYYNAFNNYWEYPLTSLDATNKLSLAIVKEFTRVSDISCISSEINPESLVSSTFVGNGVALDRSCLPHSVLKHTIRLHCGPNINSPIINTFSFIVDLTRGKMREYPFTISNLSSSNSGIKDLIIFPVLAGLPDDYLSAENCEDYNENSTIQNQCTAVWGNIIGGTINVTPYDNIQDNDCHALESSYLPVDNGSDSYSPDGEHIDRLPIAPFSILASTFIRSDRGDAPAGYNSDGTTLTSKVNVGQEMVQEYKIDKNIDLTIINSTDKVIYNPSEVSITASDLHFPSNYSFRTVRATYPFKKNVDDDNIPENGCNPCADVNVPVTTDLEVDYHITGYPTGNPKYSSIYHLESGSKLTIEPCVKLFDCTFEINAGSEIVFENIPTNINKQRYQLLYTGGIVTERDEQWLFQNKTETRTILNYEAADFIKAGTNVDNNQPQGDYIVDAGADVTFAASNQVVLKDGFRANAGSKFHAYISPVTVPGCPQRMARPDLDNSQTENAYNKNSNQFFLAPSLTTSRSFLNFKIQIEGYYSIEVLNALGETQKKFFDNRFFRANTYKLDEDFTDLAPGVYICKLSGGDEQYATKFIKSN